VYGGGSSKGSPGNGIFAVEVLIVADVIGFFGDEQVVFGVEILKNDQVLLLSHFHSGILVVSERRPRIERIQGIQ
jgi:hypothetical protein